ncbi:hypothetical protein LTR64_007106 [Lithohypha guttulata]|uniref:uncharacterized protein n=1 Tax=Lithohypha guttulata TaxID=1690604 RepID=UPI002DE162D5|nr:hypothetical protein LTR51_004338 [Lithohypha guttulata]
MVSRTLLAALVAGAAAHPMIEARQSAVNQTLESWIQRQFNISLDSAILNIGGVNGNVVEAAGTGYVVASPSTINPDYFYTWTRDSALTELMIVDELIFGTERVGNNSLQVVVEQYTRAQARLQTVTNPSGALWPAGQGLGEPKFYSNGTRFNGAWGRPQNDGPALRASTLMEIAEAIFRRNPNAPTIVSTVYWPLIYNDLLYVGQYWNTSSYDLWEEVNGNSFFTTTAQHRALVQGSIWAQRLNKTCEPCAQAPQIACFLENNFWNETGNYVLANINANQVNRSQINCDPILAAMHAFDINATCDAAALQPCNSKTLATHKVWVDSFRDLYPVNNNATAPSPVLTGRYPEDTYYGGNPWYITTAAAAEVLYDAHAQFTKAGRITVDRVSLPFWQDLVPQVRQGVYHSPGNGTALLDAVKTYADGFLSVIQTYTPANGTLNEQINRTTGEPTSAIALTWSFAALVTAVDRRNGDFPPSWGANSTTANNVSNICSWSAYNSTTKYAPVLALGASPVPTPCETEVILNLLYATGPGENTYIVGNTSVFGNTLSNTSAVIQVLRTNNVTNGNPQWFVPAWLPAGVPLEYKYVVLNSTDNTYKFENVSHFAYPPACGNNTVVSYLVNGTSLYT